MSWRHLLLLGLVVMLALPTTLLTPEAPAGPVPPGVAGLSAPSAAPASGTTALAAERHQAKRKKERSQNARRKHERREARQDRQERKRQQPEPTGDLTRAEIEAMVADAPPRIPALAADDNPCGPGLVQLGKSGRCTHGPDPAPPGATDAANRPPVTAAESRRATAAVACDGDGVSGFRIQVLYARASTTSSGFASWLNSIRAWTADADAVLRQSSIAAGQEMGFHFVMNPSCQIDVVEVPLSSGAMRSFDTMITELEQKGYDRVDRIYLIFGDTNAGGICGIGTMWDDDRDSTSNANNRGPSFARVDRICWDGPSAAHELMHSLGGVQNSAPHTSRGGHCIDEYDVMCYSDEPYYPSMTILPECTPRSTYDARYDCRFDDYFDPLPAPNTYLDTHWNTADNWFLTQAIPPGTDLAPPVVTWTAPVANGQTYEASGSSVALAANATDASGIERVEFWLYDAVADDWDFIAEDATAPYASSVAVSRLRGGLNYLTADAYDSAGNWTDEGIWINRNDGSTPNPPDPNDAAPTIVMSAAPNSVKSKKTVTLTANVSNAQAGSFTSEFRVCRGGGCAWEAGETIAYFSDLDPVVTYKAIGKGPITFVAQVSSGAGTNLSNRVTVIIKKAKKKR